MGVIVFFIYSFRGSLIQDTYLTSQVNCPAVSSLRSWVAWLSHNLFYVYKDNFFQYCDIEDSFFRFLLDAWVRTIVTGTDNTVLVWQTLPKAAIFSVVLMYVIVPVIAIFFAFAMHFAYMFEEWLGVYAEGKPDLKGNLEWSAEVIQGMAFLNIFATDAGSYPPQTNRRRRPDKDILDWFRYLKDRALRKVSFHFHDSMSTLQNAVQSLLMTFMVCRLACIWFGLDVYIYYIFRFFLGATVEKHEKWFVPNRLSNKNGIHWSSMLIDEPTLWLTGRRLGTAGAKTATKAVNLVRGPWMVLLGVLLILGFLGIYKFVNFIRWQRGEFAKAWKEQKKDVLDFDQNNVLEKRKPKD